MKYFLLLFCFIFTDLTIGSNEVNNNLVGIWESSAKDLKVKVFLVNNKVFAKLIWFPCKHRIKVPMAKHLDTKNPNKSLRNRSWLDLIILSGLEYDKNNKWINGKIYNPESGKTYTSYLRLINKNKIIVRGYWAFEFIGESMIFNRIK